MCEEGTGQGLDQGCAGGAARVALLEQRLRELEAKLARYEPAPLDGLLDGPQRSLPPDELARETARLLAVCAARGVGAVVAEAATCRDLLRALAEACFHHGLTGAGQYLNYLLCPMD